MTVVDPRLSKLLKIIALYDDPAVSEGERDNCRRFGQKIAAELGIEFSREAIGALGGLVKNKSAFEFDAGAWAAQWAAQWATMSAAQREAELREIDEMLRRGDKLSAEREAREAERAREEAARKEAAKYSRQEKLARRKSERQRIKRINAGLEPPRWDDLFNGHLAWLERIEALDIGDSEREFVSRIRAGLRDDRLGLFGDALLRVNSLIARAFSEARR